MGVWHRPGLASCRQLCMYSIVCCPTGAQSPHSSLRCAAAARNAPLPPSAPLQLPCSQIRVLKLPDGSNWLLGRYNLVVGLTLEPQPWRMCWDRARAQHAPYATAPVLEAVS